MTKNRKLAFLFLDYLMENPKNKRESGISRIVGVEESVEQELLDYFKKQFEKEQRDKIEQEHTPELRGLIFQINEKMKEFMARYGIQSLEIPGHNVHVVDKLKLDPRQQKQLEQRYEKTSGLYFPDRQQIVVLKSYAPNKKLNFTQILVHEMIHMNSFASSQKVKEGGIKLIKDGQTIYLEERRMGFEIYSIKTGKQVFFGVNEAITEELVIRFDHNHFSQFEDLREEYEERKKAIDAVVRRSGKAKEDLDPIANLEYKEADVVGSQNVILRTYTYHDERQQFKQLIDDLYEKNRDEFQSPEDVFTMFAKAALNGRLLPVARLIEKTYGKGSFRELGEKTTR